MSDYELRAVANGNLQVSLDEGKPRVDGTAIVYGALSEDLGGFRERMLPGSVELDPDLLALFDHDTSMVLGRVSAGTMRVLSSDAGVQFSAYPPDTQWARDLRTSMERGDIRGCSYRMLVPTGGDRWYVEGGEVRRDVTRALVSELTITSMPAYPQTTAEARDKALALRATDFPTTLSDDDAARMASWVRFYQLEGALEETIDDCLATGSDAMTAFADFATAGVAWLQDLLAARGMQLTQPSGPVPESDLFGMYSRARSRLGAVAHVVRSGRVLSDANETTLKNAVEMIETATENIEAVIAQVDPTYVDDDDDDTTDGSDAEGGAPNASRSMTGGAPGPSEVFRLASLALRKE